MEGRGESGETNIEVVRGLQGGERRYAILDFWERSGGLAGDSAEDRLAEAVCVIGENAHGAHVRIHPFPGARIPMAPVAPT